MQAAYLLGWSILTQVCHAQLKSCYLPNGILTADLPCDPDTPASSCCTEGWLCVTNLQCALPGFGSVIGSCTDGTWTSPACPFALNFGQPFNYNLNTTHCPDGTVCPTANNQSCCNAGQGIVEIFFHNDRTLPSDPPNLAAAMTTYYEAGDYGSVIPLPTRTSTFSSTVLIYAASTSTSTSTTAAAPLSGKFKEGTNIGIGVGLGVGIPAVVIPIWLVLRYKRKRSREKATAETGVVGPTQPMSPAVGKMASLQSPSLGQDEFTEMEAMDSPTSGVYELSGDSADLREMDGGDRDKEQEEIAI